MSDPAWYRRMSGRTRDEPHRAATPLELLFDLCFVVAVSEAAGSLHEALGTHRLGHTLVGYGTVFFAIWWAWVNFTWFASAYDTDDVLYRVVTLVQIAGALLLAAGVHRTFADSDFRLVTYGYVVMRVALVGQWLRAAHGDSDRRRTALRFAVGVTLVQTGWVVRLALPSAWSWPTFVALGIADLAVPVIAERGSTTPYHRAHIAERYGLFTLIVLGETVLAATVATRTALDTGHDTARELVLAGAGLVIVFAMWWVYFDRSAEGLLTTRLRAFVWGYGHYLIFGSAAAVGAGLAAAVDGSLSTRGTGLAVAVPVAVYVLTVWSLQIRPHQRGPVLVVYPATAGLIVLAPFTPAPLPVVAVLLAVLVAATSPHARRFAEQ